MNKRGTLAILFLGLGFLVFVGLVFAGKIAPKENYVGKSASDLYLGSEHLHTVLFFHRIAGRLALDEALTQHRTTGQEPCLVENVRLWDHDRCTFSAKNLLASYLNLLDISFSHHLHVLLSNSTVPPYTFKFANNILTIQSSQPFIYEKSGFKYSTPITLELRHDSLAEYLNTYQRIYDTITLRAPCLLQQQSGDLNSCFSQQDFTLRVQQHSDYLFFSATDITLLRNIEIRFAIPLNSLDELSSIEHISF